MSGENGKAKKSWMIEGGPKVELNIRGHLTLLGRPHGLGPEDLVRKLAGEGYTVSTMALKLTEMGDYIVTYDKLWQFITAYNIKHPKEKIGVGGGF